MFETPLLFLIFNRPDTTSLAFQQIKRLKPKYLFVAADGPRHDKIGENEKCLQTRCIVQDNIDWDCNVKYLIRKENLGCGIAVSQAITWFFENVEEGIILEDDIIPDLTFFDFCTEMLAKYRNCEEIMHVGGISLLNDKIRNSYYFSNFPFIWGWATWRRAWKFYNIEIHNQINDNKLYDILKKTFRKKEILKFWSNIFQHLQKQKISYTWDYQWFLTIWEIGGKCILPNANLVSNIGFNHEATHTKLSEHHLSNRSSNHLLFPIKHPSKTKIDRKSDLINYYAYYNPEGLQKNVFKFLLSNFKKIKFRTKMFINNILRRIVFKIIPELSDYINHKQSILNCLNYIYNSKISVKSIINKPHRIANSSIDDYTYVATNGTINNCMIGKFCSIGPNFIGGWGIHPINGISTSPMFYSPNKQNGFSLSEYSKIEETKQISIGNDVFIGMNVKILDGVNIGHGAVIGAGAVVVSDIPPYAVAVGVPAQVIKYRFEKTEIEKFLKINWWDWPYEKLNIIEKYFFQVQEFFHNSE